MKFTVDRIDHLVINCRDVEITASWYQRVLGMDREEFGTENRTALKFGGQKINLRPHDFDIRRWPSGRVTDAGAVDICFVTGVGAEDVVEHFRDCGVTVEAGPVPKQGALGLMTSVYCRDPDGNLVEVSSYLDS